MKTLITSLLLLSLATFAGAEGDTLTFEDAALDAMPPPANAWADIVRASLTLVEGETLVATIELTALPEFQPGVAYGFLFRAGDREHYLAAFTAPDLAFAYGPWGGDEDGPNDFHAAKGAYTTGAGATVTIEMPVAYLDGAPVAFAPRAMTADIKTGILPVGDGPVLLPLDEAEGTGELALPRSAADAPAAEARAEESAAALVEPAEAAPAPEGETAPDEAPMRVPAAGAFAAIGALVGAFLAARSRA